MSTRMLKKLYGGADIIVHNEEYVSSDELQTSQDETKYSNPFACLKQQDLSESDVKDDNDLGHAMAVPGLPGGADTGAISKRKKNKKRKAKTKFPNIDKSKLDKELNKALKANELLQAKIQENKIPIEDVTPSRAETEKSLLKVEIRHLNPLNELRAMFGKSVVKLEKKRNHSKYTLKSIHMVTAKETWPPATKHITMERVQPPERYQTLSDKIQWFAFQHNLFYQSLQKFFVKAVARADTDFFISIIERQPYHVDSLIELSEVCKMTEDFSEAVELVERSVFILESSLAPCFNMSSGNCRLDFNRQENRAFFIVLFKYAQVLESRACSRTSLELSKLILSFDPIEDPLAMVLVIDYYALRSQQYAWLVKFFEGFLGHGLDLIPNMAYSYALALFCMMGECEKSDKALQSALYKFPGVLCPLLNELSIKTDERVQSSEHFKISERGSLHQQECLYVCRAKVVWCQNNVRAWLQHNINAVLDMLESGADVIADLMGGREVRDDSAQNSILRHVLLSDFKEKVPLAPFITRADEPILAYDPLPPKDSFNCYDNKHTWKTRITGVNRSVLLFLESLMLHQPQQQTVLMGDATRRNGSAVTAQINSDLESLYNNPDNTLDDDEDAIFQLAHSITNELIDMTHRLFSDNEDMELADDEKSDSPGDDADDSFQ